MVLEDVFRWKPIAEVDILGAVAKDFKQLAVDRWPSEEDFCCSTTMVSSFVQRSFRPEAS